MRALKAFYNRYSQYIWSVLQPLGGFGVFAVAFIDSAAVGMPLDPLVGYYVYHRPSLCWLYILMASAGSALGSSVIYLIGRKGGHLLLHSKMSKERVERMRVRFEQHEFLALMLPSMLPPPTPFKLFLLSAAVFQMNFRDYLLAIFFGRVVRFAILTALVLWLGPQVIAIAGDLLRDHLALTLVIFFSGVVLIVWYIRHRTRRRALQIES